MKQITKTLARLIIIIYNLILKLKRRKNNNKTKPKIERNKFGYPTIKQ